MKNLRSLYNHGWFRVLLAIVLLSSISLYIRDSRGVTFGLLGVFFWLAVALFSATFGVIYFAQFLTPIAGDNGWWQGISLIRRAFGSSPPADTRNVEERKEKKGRRRRKKTVASATPVNPDAPPPSFKTLRAGILRPYQAFALVRGKKYVGARGPGFVVLNPKEKIRHTIDLRTQKRTERRVRVTTRDAIQIVTNITVNFCIKSGDHSQNKPILYPYDQNAIFQISYADAIDGYGDPMPWKDKIVPQAITYAIQEVSKYTLNELMQLENGVSNIDEINRVVQQRMEEKFAKRGVEILRARLSNPALPNQILNQYFNEWKARWDEKIQEKYAVREAQALRQRKEARARAQNKMIQAIARNLSQMQQKDDSDMVEIITLRMIEALEEAVAEGSVRAKIPQEIMARLIENTSKQLRESTPNAALPPPPDSTLDLPSDPSSDPLSGPSTDPIKEPPSDPGEPISEPPSSNLAADFPVSEELSSELSSSNLATESTEPIAERPSSNLPSPSDSSPSADPPSEPTSNLPLAEEPPEAEQQDETVFDEPQPPQFNLRKSMEDAE